MSSVKKDISSNEAAKAILARVKALQRSSPNGPSGVPKRQSNSTTTSPDFPTEHNQPTDLGWAAVDTIAGSGQGPRLTSR